MSQAYSGGATVLHNTTIERVRELPLPGSITVSIGDYVQGSEVIGFASLSGEGVLVRVSEELGIPPKEAMQTISVRVGDWVKKGDKLATHSVFFGLFRAEVTAPVSGEVELVSELTGTIMLRCRPIKIERTAFISGRVSHVHDNLSVTIKTRCSLVQGVFGVGGERLGHICMLPDTGSITTLSSTLAIDGAVLVSRGAPSLELLKEGARCNIAGWIAGSIDDIVIEKFAKRRIGVAITGDESVPFSLFVTEGFGEIPMNDEAWGVFSRNQGREISMTGVTQVRAGAIRPEAIIGLTEQSVDSPDCQENAESGLIIGRAVRIIRHPYFGRIGFIKELPPEPRLIPSGASARIAVISFEDGATVEIPRANIELLGSSHSGTNTVASKTEESL
jgi:hypothetical protein